MKESPVLIDQLIIESLLEILGTASLQAVINVSGTVNVSIEEKKIVCKKSLSLNEWEKVIVSIVSLFGKRGGQGIILQSGRVFFKNYFRTYGYDLGMMDPKFRMLSKGKRIRKGFDIFSQEISGMEEFTCSVLDDPSKWYWKIEYNSLDLNNKPYYESFLIGLLQEFLSWTSGGKYYPIKKADELTSESNKSIIQIQKKYIS